MFLPLVRSAASEEIGGGSPSLQDFSASVVTGEGNRLVGVYAQGVIANPVVLQPEGDYGFISSHPDELTQFRLAKEVGVTGILAHNYLAGKKFFDLVKGMIIDLVYNDGLIVVYEVVEITRYQVLYPYKSTSNMVDLQTGEEFTAAEVFARHYMNEGQLTFQTCIKKSGSATWGRIFITAQTIPPF